MKRYLYVCIAIIVIVTTVMPLHSSAANQMGTAPALKEIAVDYASTQILTEDGVQLLWGRMDGNEEPPVPEAPTNIPSVIAGLNDITDLSVSNSHAVALNKNGIIWRWGMGAGGIDEFAQSSDVWNLTHQEPEIIQVQASQDNTYALNKDGTVLEWGNFDTDTSPPHLIQGLDHVKAIYSSFFLKEDGSVWNVNYGTSVATPYSNLTNVIKIAGTSNTHFLKEDGTVWADKSYYSGNKKKESYVQIEGLPKIVDITTASDTAFALSEDGDLYGWGNNSDGTLGDGTATKALTPKLILSNVRLLSSADGDSRHVMVQKKDRSLWTWGYNVEGCLGVVLPDKKKNAPLPVQVQFVWPKQNVWDQTVNLNMNGKSLFFAADKPFLTVKQEVMVPALSFAKQQGWSASLANGTLQLSNNSNSLTVTKNSMKSGKGSLSSGLASAQFVNGEVFVPLRALSEAFEFTSKYYIHNNSIGIYSSAFKEWNQLDNYGNLKRTTGLPGNAADFPYILAGVPNVYYEKAFPKSNSAISFKAAQLYRSKESGKPVKLTEEEFGRYANHISRYYQLLLNADYRTINMDWAAELESHTGGTTSLSGNKTARQLKMESYVNWIKNNKVIIQGNVRPEPSMISLRNGLLYMRTYFQYQIVQANSSDYLKLRKDRVIQLLAAPTGKSVIGKYAMYVDVPLVADAIYGNDSYWGYWADGLKVDARANDIMPTPWEKLLAFTIMPK